MVKSEDNSQPELADKLFGPRAPISDDIIAAISDPEGASDKPFPVRVLTYIDPHDRTVRRQLDSRGIRITEGLMTTGGKGITRIKEIVFSEYQEATGEGNKIDFTLHDSQASMSVVLHVVKINNGKVVVKTELGENEHGISSPGPRYYEVNANELPPVFRESHPNIISIEGVNWGLLTKNAIVDLINE